MKKTLLIAAAALAASVISSQAQVYSQNIVGYVNIVSSNGYTAMANPLGNGGNSATNFVDVISGNQDGNAVLTWTGSKYTAVNVDSSSGTGFSDPSTFAPKPAPILPPGKGFLLQNNTGVNITNTFVGTVVVGGAGVSTNVVGIVTNVLSAATAYVLPGSALPIGGGITSVLGLNNPGGAIDGCTVLIPNIVSGAIHGYKAVNFDSSSGTGFSDPSTFNPVPEPVIPVGGSFLFQNSTGSDILWIQSL